jgi:hypothetical protein
MRTHLFLIRTKWLRVFWRGSFAWLEIDFGAAGEKELAIFLFTSKGLISVQWYDIK